MKFKIGEMAKLNNVTIHTLRHYDKIGILKPTSKDDNDYRYYSIYDCSKLNRIKAYKSMGFSLDEIKTLVNGEIEDVEAALNSLKSNLEIEQTRIDILKSYVGDQLDALRKVKDDTFIKEPRIEIIEDRTGHLMSVTSETKEKDIIQIISDFEKERSGHGEIYFQPSRLNGIIDGTIKLQAYFAIDRIPKLDDEGFLLEGGEFLVIDHLGGMTDIENSYNILYEYIENHDLQVEGTVVELLLIPEAITPENENRITQIQIKLR